MYQEAAIPSPDCLSSVADNCNYLTVGCRPAKAQGTRNLGVRNEQNTLMCLFVCQSRYDTTPYLRAPKSWRTTKNKEYSEENCHGSLGSNRKSVCLSVRHICHICWLIIKFQHILTRMWANAQRDGRPAYYRWRRLFNAAVWLTPTIRVPCSNAANTRNPLKFAGVPQTHQQISAVSGPFA